jgi:hypothetical protein
MTDEEDDEGDEGIAIAMQVLRETPRRSLAERQAAEERFHKAHYFPKWLQEAGVIEFLDFLVVDSGTTPEAHERAKDLRDRLTKAGRT